jgi:hypothetical protein
MRYHVGMKTPVHLFGLVTCLFASGCSEPDPASTECEQSGGEWREVSDCPSACEPPAPTADACETIEELQCATVCGDIPTCSCPVDTPFWQDGLGCVGFEACPDTGT